MALILIRSVLLYLLTLLAMRAMGKRQLGQLQPFELVIVLIISEMASLAMQSNTTPIMISIVPILTITLLQMSLSLLNLKCQGARQIICGKPVIIMSKGELQQGEMRKLRLNLNDVLELCRAQGYFDISELDTIVMETNGQFSVFPTTQKRSVEVADLALDIPDEQVAEIFVLDGKISYTTLKHDGKDERWLQKQLKNAKIDNVQELFIAGTDSTGQFFFQKKQCNQRKCGGLH